MAVLGRPRGFDREKALEAAMLTFWRKGFLAASMNDLCEAMGIRSPSLYAAFKDKESLYIEALALYTRSIRDRLWRQLETGTTARAAMENFFAAAAAGLPAGGKIPDSCMTTLASVDSDTPSTVATAIKAARREGLELIRARLDKAVTDAELSASTDTHALGQFYFGVFQGMAIQARDGATTAELNAMAAAAMTAWP